MKTIPQIRADLLVIANNDLALNEPLSRRIKNLVRMMKRRKAVRRTATEHVEFTPVLARAIRTYAYNNKRVSYAAMSRRFHVSIGRISEALIGKRQAA